MNNTQKVADAFMNVVLMHGFRKIDEQLFDYVERGADCDIDAFNEAYQYMIADVQQYIAPAEA